MLCANEKCELTQKSDYYGVFYMKYYSLLESISNSLIKMSETSIIDNIFPFLFGLVSTLIGIFVGYKISNFQENKKTMINNYWLFRHYSGRIIQLEKSKMSNMLFLKSFLREMLPKRHI